VKVPYLWPFSLHTYNEITCRSFRLSLAGPATSNPAEEADQKGERYQEDRLL
jgi:hypothetical protein